MRRFFGRPTASTADGTPIIAGDNTPDPNRTEDHILIKHGKDEFTLSYPLASITSGTLTVASLREDCSKRTSVDPGRISLVCAGKNLKDDAATLSSLGISNAARILLIASVALPPAVEQQQKKRRKKKAKKEDVEVVVKVVVTPMEKIEEVWEGIVANLVPLTNEFVENPPADPGKRADAHRRLSETMMGELLKLDSVESSEPEVRARRKGVVKDIQRILDGLDKVLKEQAAMDVD